MPPPALVLTLAIFGISFAGPLVRLSHAHPLAIAVWRLFFSLVVIGAILRVNRGWKQWRRLDRRGVALAVAAGVMLALHFWSWNASIGLTTVAASVVLVNTQPVVVAVLSIVWLREPPTPKQWLGIAIAMGGALVVAMPDFLAPSTTARNPLLGDGLAVI